jgi:uncharacterized protein YvpB
MGAIVLLRLDGRQALARDGRAAEASGITYRAMTERLAHSVDRSVAAWMQDTRAAFLAAHAGWRTVDGRRQYFFADGTGAKDAVVLDGVAVTFDEQGTWLSSRLEVPYVSQLPNMPSGCEVASVAMMLNHAGIAVSKEELAAALPYASDPNEGFTGSVYSAGGYGFGGIIWPPALLGLVEGYRGSAVDLTGESWEVVRGFIDAGKPVCVWFSEGGLDHTVLLTGYSDSAVWLNDPLVDKDVELDLDTFLTQWEQNGYRALSY